LTGQTEFFDALRGRLTIARDQRILEVSQNATCCAEPSGGANGAFIPQACQQEKTFPRGVEEITLRHVEPKCAASAPREDGRLHAIRRIEVGWESLEV
jgi:hypothetical protein